MGRPKKEKEENKNDKLSNAIASLSKQFGEGIVTNLEDNNALDIECFSTGSIAVDNALGRGIPRGRIIEFYGAESSAKTLLALSCISEIQRSGGKALFVDTEMAFDKSWARKNGVNTKELIFSQPSFAEEAFTLIEEFVETGEVDLIVLDSVATLVCKAELDGDMGDSHMALTARLMSQALRKLVGVCAKTGTTIIFINQVRANIGVIYGPKLVTSGGNSLKFYSSIRCELKRKETVKKGDEVLATNIEVKVVKNKVAPPYKSGMFEVRFDSGLCRATDLINIALENGIIEKSGAWFVFGEEKFQGQENLRDHVLNNKEVQNKLRDEINNLLEAKK